MARLEAGEHLDPTAELSLEAVKSRAVKGIAALTGRTLFLQSVALIATFALTVFLSPSQYGVFFLVSAVVNFFAYFGDIGLAAALIQKKERVTQEELRTTFTVQQLLVLVLLTAIFLLTPVFGRFYGLSQEGIYLLWALAFSLLLSSLKTIPSVLLERELDFNKLVIPQIVETVLFYGVAAYLAWQGFGITSFTAAVLVRGVAGLILIYLLRPWLPGIAFSKASLRGLLRFGVPYQANTLLAVVKDDGMTAVLGGILGTAGIGLLGWAQKWAQAPLRFFMDQVIKVTFPAYSRMQDKKKELETAVSRSIFFVCLLVFPTLVGLVLLAPPLTQIIPRYEKWQPALLALFLISINSAWAAVSTPLTNLFNAIGKITITLRLMIMWAGLTWLFLPALALVYGVNGAAAGFALVGTSSAVAIFIARRFVSFDLIGSVGKPLLASLGMGLLIFFLRSLVPLGFAWILLLVAVGAAAYFLLLYLLVGPAIISDSKKVFSAFRS